MDDRTYDDRPIVVGVDHSDSAREAAEWAADLAAVWQAPLHLLTAIPGAMSETTTESTWGWLTELRDATVRAGARTSIVDIASGDTVDLIADRARGAKMLVLGSYGEGAWAGTLAGPVALALLARVDCPVAVIRGTAPLTPPPRSGPVVVGVDGSSVGRAALRLAADLATSLGSRLVAVHAWTDIAFGVDGAARRSTANQKALAAAASAVLDAELAPFVLTHPDLPLQRVVVLDTPLRALLATAVGARLVVVGHRGAIGSGMGLGSTSQSLVEFVPCPVVVTGHETRTMPAAHATSATGVTV